MNINKITSFFQEGKSVYLVKIETDEGVCGYGDCSPMDPAGVRHIIHDLFAPQLIGINPLNIAAIEESLVRKNYKINGQLLGMAYSGIDIALWDLMGKYLSQPVFTLLGGRLRDSIAYYGSSLSRNLSPEAEAEKVLKAIDQYGFQAIKIKVGARMGQSNSMPNLDADAEKIRIIRRILGDKITLLIDANSSYKPHEAVMLSNKVQEYNVAVFEEPCPYYDLNAYRRLSQTLPVPVSVGEQEYSIHSIKELIASGYCQIFGADVTKCGGFSNLRRVGELCAMYEVNASPHNTNRGLGLMATNQFAVYAQAADFYQEYLIEKPGMREKYVTNRPIIREGKFTPEALPGVGAILDEERMHAELIVAVTV